MRSSNHDIGDKTPWPDLTPSVTECPNCSDLYDEGPGDTTVRPIDSPVYVQLRPPTQKPTGESEKKG
jgi:hypothetical protein